MKKILMLAVICLPILFGSCAKKVVNTSISIYGTVVDAATHDPIQDVLLTLMPSSRNCYTGSDGSYQFEDLNALQYTITAQMGGYKTDRKTVTLTAGDKEEVTFALHKE